MSSNPAPSPQPPQPRSDEPTTGEYYVAYAENVVREFRAQEAAQKKSPLGAVLVFLGGAAGAISICFGAYFIVVGEAKAQAKAEVQVVDQKATATASELERYKGEADARFKTLERQGDRNEKKLDALLDRLNVPNPAPRPTDGGTP